MLLRISAVVAVALVAGCMNGGIDEPATGGVEQHFGGGSGNCTEWMCGTNSPEIDGLGFWDLNLPKDLNTPGKPNKAGFQLVWFVKNSVKYLPNVFQGQLTASNKKTTLRGKDLIDGSLVLINKTKFPGIFFDIRVTEVDHATSWAQPARPLESYKLDWSEIPTPVPPPGSDKQKKNVCNNPPSRDNRGETGDMNIFHILLFEGDRIEAEPKLDTDVDNTWFNLGCAGSALAKMALTGHTEAALNLGSFNTTLDQRQAILKMFAADYCGDGHPFTVAGQPLSWADDAGTLKLAAVPLKREARWYEKGAACLDDARIDVNPTPAGLTEFPPPPSLYERVKAYCPARLPPSCSGGTLDTDGFHLISATPTP